MSLAVGRQKLLDGVKTIQARWHDVCREWDDPQRRAFEKEVLDVLESDLRQAVNAIESMTAQVERATSECQDRGGLWS